MKSVERIEQGGLLTTSFFERNVIPHQLRKEVVDFANKIDHTILKSNICDEDIYNTCNEAYMWQFKTVCVNSSYISLVAKLLDQSSVLPIAVVGFPLGANLPKSKAFEAQIAIENGACEIDMVLNVAALKSKRYDFVLADIQGVVEAAKPYPVKVILEMCYLDEEEKRVACILSMAAGAHFVKTSTGFGSWGATVDDVQLMRGIVGSQMEVKASGGIRTLADAEKMFAAGADRIGASASVKIIDSLIQND